MFEVRLLGQFEILVDGQPVDIPSRPAQLLLAYLALHHSARHRRERLAGLLWPDSPETNARANLRKALWRLRQLLGDDIVEVGQADLALALDGVCYLDIRVLQNELEGLSFAVSAYRGELLPGFYEDWVLRERDRLQAVFEQKMKLLLEQLVEAARWPEVLQWAEHWIAFEQVPEPAYRALMQAHAARGDRANLTSVYQRCVAALDEELAVTPSPKTVTLYEELMSSEAAPVVEQGVDAWQPRWDLPAPTTPLVGRKAELEQVTARLSEPDCRLLTLVGPGGIGKTRLAIEAARLLHDDFQSGVVFVPLAHIASPDEVPSAFAAAFDLLSSASAGPLAQVLSFLRAKRMLLVVDNVEHVLEGATFLVDVLNASPGVRILATSRRRLRLAAETVYEVEGLAVPTSNKEEDLEQYEAVQMFMGCARRAQGGLSLTGGERAAVARLCRLVGGVPLALELAAAWTRALLPSAIVAELEADLGFLESSLQDIPDRQRSLRAVFHHSWQLLSTEERAVFCRLSVFRGDFRREPAQQVAAASLWTLTALVDTSMLKFQPASGRYELHPLLRQFAEERLESSGEEQATRDSHCVYYLAGLDRQAAHLKGHGQQDAFDRMQAELPDYLAAWEWASANAREEELDAAAESFTYFYTMLQRFPEGEELFKRTVGALAQHRTPVSRPLLGRLMSRWAWFCGVLQRSDEAEQLASESLQIALEAEDRREEAYSLLVLADKQGIEDVGQEHLAYIASLYEAEGDAWGLATVWNWRGMAHWVSGQLDDALRCWAECVAICDQRGDRWSATGIRANMGHVMTNQGDFERGRRHLEESLAAMRDMGLSAVAEGLPGLAWNLACTAEYEAARIAVEESIALRKEFGLMLWPGYFSLALCAWLEGDLASAEHAARRSIAAVEEDGLPEQLKGHGLAMLALVANERQRYEEALAIGRESLEQLLAVDRTYVWLPAAALAWAASQLGQQEAAWDYLQQGLDLFGPRGPMPQRLYLTIVGARMLAAVGEVEQVVRLAAFVKDHTGSTHWARAEAAGLLATVQAEFDQSAFAVLQAEGRELDRIDHEILFMGGSNNGHRA